MSRVVIMMYPFLFMRRCCHQGGFDVLPSSAYFSAWSRFSNLPLAVLHVVHPMCLTLYRQWHFWHKFIADGFAHFFAG